MTGPGRLGEVRASRDGFAVRFDRRLAAAPPVLWAWLTEPARLARWLDEVRVEPGTGPGKGTRATLLAPGAPVDLTVRYCDPERMLEVAWQTPGGRETGGRETEVVVEVVELTPGRCLVVLEHRGLATDEVVEQAAGWHACLDALDAVLAGGDRGPVEQLRELVLPAYEQAFAALPGQRR